MHRTSICQPTATCARAATSSTRVMQVVDGEPVVVKARNGRSAEGIPEKHVRIIRIPVRDPVREVLKA